MSQPIEAALVALCAKHALSRIDIGTRANGRCQATVWWDGYTKSGTACEMGHGANAAQAIESAIHKAASDRIPEADAEAGEMTLDEAA